MKLYLFGYVDTVCRNNVRIFEFFSYMKIRNIIVLEKSSRILNFN